METIIKKRKVKVEKIAKNPVFLSEQEAWNWSKFLVPELFEEISSLLTVRNSKRFQFYKDLKLFIKTWKKENK